MNYYTVYFNGIAVGKIKSESLKAAQTLAESKAAYANKANYFLPPITSVRAERFI